MGDIWSNRVERDQTSFVTQLKYDLQTSYVKTINLNAKNAKQSMNGSNLTSIARLLHVNDLDLTAQILVSPCHTCPVYGIIRSIYRTGLTWKNQNLGRKVEVKYMNKPFNAC